MTEYEELVEKKNKLELLIEAELTEILLNTGSGVSQRQPPPPVPLGSTYSLPPSAPILIKPSVPKLCYSEPEPVVGGAVYARVLLAMMLTLIIYLCGG